MSQTDSIKLLKYNIESKDFQFTEKGQYIRTHIYSFTLL